MTASVRHLIIIFQLAAFQILDGVLVGLHPKDVVELCHFRGCLVVLPNFVVEYQNKFCEVLVALFPLCKCSVKSVLDCWKSEAVCYRKSLQKVVCNV